MKSNQKASSTRAKSSNTAAVWGIRGVSNETRIAVGKAARRAGMGIGEYVDRALRDAATGTLKDQPVAPRIEDTLAQLVESMTKQAEAQKALAEQEQRRAVELDARLAAIEARTAAQAEQGDRTPGDIFRALSGLFRRKQTPSDEGSEPSASA